MQLVFTLQTTSMILTHDQQGQPQQWGYGTLSLSPSSPQILCFNSNSTYPTLEPDQRMSWVWPRVLEAEVEWTQQKKRYCEGADKVPNSYITIPSSARKKNLAAFPQTSFLLSIDSVYLHFIQMQMVFHKPVLYHMEQQ